MENLELHLAEDYVLNTRVSIFLTGKAGTGKTTFLKNILKKTNKNFAVVAPTGVAAINAGGVTIHSMFQLPTKTFLPSHDFLQDERFTNWKILPQTQKLRKERRELFIELDLLVIDEISMVRADLLDAIDFTLRRIRKSTEAFGGVQLLVIGDLFQLSPVVKQADWSELHKYYSSPFFFDSIAWKKLNSISIELKKVYRQEEEHFINILNEIRSNTLTDKSLQTLNENFGKNYSEKQIITLTTHNHKANKINNDKLESLNGSVHKFSASVKGRFSESAYPASESIHLKTGAQVMFIKNHPEQLYFNGKIGTVIDIKDEKLTVRCEGEKHNIVVVKELWENINYKVNPETKQIEQNKVGSFEQYPLRLAWAVTVHKSQGLSFDEIVLDLEDSFAPGQLYVALSRCRTLDGLHLSSKIRPENVIVNNTVIAFQQTIDSVNDLTGHLDKAKEAYEMYVLKNSFSLDKLISYIESWESYVIDSNAPSKGDAILFSKNLEKVIFTIQDIVVKFQKQLDYIFEKDDHPIEHAMQRMSDAIGFFTKEINNKIIVSIENHMQEWKEKPKTTSYIKNAKILVSTFWDHIESLYKLEFKDEKVFKSEQLLKRRTKIKAKKKNIKGETFEQSLKLFKEGKSLKEIAKIRDLAVSTIESHMGRLLSEDKIQIKELIKPDRLDKLIHEISDKLTLGSNDIMKKSKIQLSYSEIRWVRNYLLKEEEKLNQTEA